MKRASNRWMVAGLLAQLGGVASEAAWAVLPQSTRSGTGTNWGFLVDHVVSNAGVVAVLVGAALTLRDRRSLSRAVVGSATLGATLETIGAAADMARHVSGQRGGEAIIYPTLAAGAALAIGSLVLGRPASRAVRS